MIMLQIELDMFFLYIMYIIHFHSSPHYSNQFYQYVSKICIPPGEFPSLPFHVEAPTNRSFPSAERDTADPNEAPSTVWRNFPRGHMDFSCAVDLFHSRATPLSAAGISSHLPLIPPQAIIFPSSETAAENPISSFLNCPTMVYMSSYCDPFHSNIWHRPACRLSSQVNAGSPTTNIPPIQSNTTRNTHYLRQFNTPTLNKSLFLHIKF